MENQLVSLKISEDMVKGIVEKQIQQAIINQLGDADKYMEAMIGLALHQKVNSSGTVSNYSSENKNDFIDVLLQKSVQDASREAIHEFISENKDKLKSALKKELEKTATRNKLIETFINGAINSFESKWSFQCHVNFETPQY